MSSEIISKKTAFFLHFLVEIYRRKGVNINMDLGDMGYGVWTAPIWL
jgi:hypothetical protein